MPLLGSLSLNATYILLPYTCILHVPTSLIPSGPLWDKRSISPDSAGLLWSSSTDSTLQSKSFQYHHRQCNHTKKAHTASHLWWVGVIGHQQEVSKTFHIYLWVGCPITIGPSQTYNIYFGGRGVERVREVHHCCCVHQLLPPPSEMPLYCTLFPFSISHPPPPPYLPWQIVALPLVCLQSHQQLCWQLHCTPWQSWWAQHCMMCTRILEISPAWCIFHHGIGWSCKSWSVVPE